MDRTQTRDIFDIYFRLFPWTLDHLRDKTGADFGCGSGRWAALLAPFTTALYCIDASEGALATAASNLSDISQVRIMHASLADMHLLSNASLDFGYCLGVLHHTPDPLSGLQEISRVLRPGAPLLLYLYYAFDNRPKWFALLWRISNFARTLISALPRRAKFIVCDLIAFLVYWPLARAGRTLERIGKMPRNWPLAAYRHRSLYVMRNDALDRFGTPLEKRFSKQEISAMLATCGFERVTFSDIEPFWVSIAYKK
jgi:SAM-dependent methyltransferase